MIKRTLFLLVNDDGVYAPGIKALREAVADLGDVITVAPSQERSAQSQAITINQPLRLHDIDKDIYAVDGTPADCVMLALQHVLPRRPDWVLSGINRGGNLGTDTLYSGTVGAALEAAVSGIPAMAFSLEGRGVEVSDYAASQKIVRLFVERSADLRLGVRRLLNVNIPHGPYENIRGIVAAPTGRRNYDNQMVDRMDPRGKRYFWIGGAHGFHEEIPGTDCVLLYNDYVTVSVLRADFCDAAATNDLGATLKELL